MIQLTTPSPSKIQTKPLESTAKTGANIVRMYSYSGCYIRCCPFGIATTTEVQDEEEEARLYLTQYVFTAAGWIDSPREPMLIMHTDKLLNSWPRDIIKDEDLLLRLSSSKSRSNNGQMVNVFLLIAVCSKNISRISMVGPLTLFAAMELSRSLLKQLDLDLTKKIEKTWTIFHTLLVANLQGMLVSLDTPLQFTSGFCLYLLHGMRRAQGTPESYTDRAGLAWPTFFFSTNFSPLPRVVKVISEQIEAVITGSCLSSHCLHIREVQSVVYNIVCRNIQNLSCWWIASFLLFYMVLLPVSHEFDRKEPSNASDIRT